MTDLRNALKADSMEAIECLHCWMKSGIVGGLKRSEEDLAEGILSDLESQFEEYVSGRE